MYRYYKKPKEIDAVYFDGENRAEVEKFLTDRYADVVEVKPSKKIAPDRMPILVAFSYILNGYEERESVAKGYYLIKDEYEFREMHKTDFEEKYASM